MTSRGNGCGPSGVVGKFVPDNLIKLSIAEACTLHDMRYDQGGTSEDRKSADKEFLDAMLTVISSRKSSSLTKGIRKVKAYVYYFSVRLFGGFFFEK